MAKFEVCVYVIRDLENEHFPKFCKKLTLLPLENGIAQFSVLDDTENDFSVFFNCTDKKFEKLQKKIDFLSREAKKQKIEILTVKTPNTAS